MAGTLTLLNECGVFLNTGLKSRNRTEFIRDPAFIWDLAFIRSSTVQFHN